MKKNLYTLIPTELTMTKLNFPRIVKLYIFHIPDSVGYPTVTAEARRQIFRDFMGFVGEISGIFRKFRGFFWFNHDLA